MIGVVVSIVLVLGVAVCWIGAMYELHRIEKALERAEENLKAARRAVRDAVEGE